MSAKIKEKLLRVPCDKLGITDPWQFAKDNPREFCHEKETSVFRVSPTESPYIDYVLESAVTTRNPAGFARVLTQEERDQYGAVFSNLFPGIDMSEIHLVSCIWYDGTEMPDYYDCAPYWTIKRISIIDVISATEDPDVITFIQDEKRFLGENGNIVIRFSGIAPENRIFIEGENEELCNQCVEKFKELLLQKGYM